MSGQALLFWGILLTVLALVGWILIGAGIVASEDWTQPHNTGKKFKKGKKKRK